MSHAYRVEPHHPQDPDGEGEIDHQDDDEQQDKQVEAALPPAIDADLVDVVGHRPRHAAALGGGDILLPHHLLAGHNTRRQVHGQQKQMLKRKKRTHTDLLLFSVVGRGMPQSQRSLSRIRESRPWKVTVYNIGKLTTQR